MEIVRALSFRHQTIDADPPGSFHVICLTGDVNGNGRPDVVIGCKEGDVNLYWYENPSWVRHDMAQAPHLEAGGVMIDVNGNGRLDLVAGQEGGYTDLYWFANPSDARHPWQKHMIEDRFNKYHDQAAGDVDDDGELEIVTLSQGKRLLAYYDIPADPTVSPWPRACCHIIAEDLHVESLQVLDVDGDGLNEIVAGTHLFRPDGDPRRPWKQEILLKGYGITTGSRGNKRPGENRVRWGDLDGDGQPEMVVSEAEIFPARIAWCKGPHWTPQVLRDDLFHLHSLAVADFDGDGRLDIFAAEMGLGRNPDPKMFIFRNLGNGRFEEVLIGRGIPTHEAKIADITGNGLPDIVGKPYDPERHIDLWLNESTA